MAAYGPISCDPGQVDDWIKKDWLNVPLSDTLSA